jgi:predicted dehydrogenase
MKVKMMMVSVGLGVLAVLGSSVSTSAEPLRVAVAGLTHDHVRGLLGKGDHGEIELVGIAERNTGLANRYIEQFHLKSDLLYPDLASLVDAVHPEAVCAFGSIREHLDVVRFCAPRGIHVMVEKPLAMSVEHALEMAELARKHNILLLTNYETTWYASTQESMRRVRDENEIGRINKVVVHDGHRGPKEIGVSKEFLEWLTDPAENGAGALIDFGCYGANLATSLMNGEAPVSVWATTQQLKPDVYPKVDDNATLVLSYKRGQAIIQASWNWPVSRKDMEIYGSKGQMFAPDGNTLLVWDRDVKTPETLRLPKNKRPFDDPFSYLAAAVRGEVDASKGLSSLENNLVVVQILDAAMKSAKSGQPVSLIE